MKVKYGQRLASLFLCLILIVSLFAGLTPVAYAEDPAYPQVTAINFTNGTWTVSLPIVDEIGGASRQEDVTFTSSDVSVNNYPAPELIGSDGEYTTYKLGTITLNYGDSLILQPTDEIWINCTIPGESEGEFSFDYTGVDDETVFADFPGLNLTYGVDTEGGMFFYKWIENDPENEEDDEYILYYYDVYVTGNNYVGTYASNWTYDSGDTFTVDLDKYTANLDIGNNLTPTWGTSIEESSVVLSNGQGKVTLTKSIGASKEYTVLANMPWPLTFTGRQEYTINSIKAGDEIIINNDIDLSNLTSLTKEIWPEANVEITVSPNGEDAENKVIKSVSIIDSNNTALDGVIFDGNTITFTMPATSVRIDSITFEEQAVEGPRFTTHGLLLSGEIGVKFRVSFPEGFDTEGCYVVFVATDGRTSNVQYSDAEGITESTDVFFNFNINALELAEKITATLYYGDGETVVSEEYSAMDYIQTVREKMPDNQKLMAIIDALQAYGFYLQQSDWNDDMTHLAIPEPSKALTDSDITAAMSGVSSMQIIKDLDGSGIVDAKFALTLNAKTVINVSVKPDTGVTITSTGYTLRTIGSDTYYMFKTDKIGPKYLGKPYTVTVNTSQGSANIEGSAMSYVNAALNSVSFTNAQKLALAAYYYYYVAAVNY